MLTMTTSCDAGVRVDLACDSCDVLFAPRPAVPPVPAEILAAAAARGWSDQEGLHYCPSCARTRGPERLAEVAPA